jgi:C-terminal processing protease CtpA/Prc
MSQTDRNLLSWLALAAPTLALCLVVNTAWSQNQNQSNRGQDQQDQYDSQNYNQRSDNQNFNQRSTNQDDSQRSDARDRGDQGGMRDQRSDERSQNRLFNRSESRDTEQDSGFRDRREDRSLFGRRDNSQDEPAGLGVMLDTSAGDIQVREVAGNSPAERAGLRRGDQIVAINGQRVDSPQQLTQLVRQQQPGSEVDIRIRRDGQQRTLTAELESRRQALDTLNRNQQGQWQQNRGEQDEWQRAEFDFRNSPPWSDDELMQHISEMERHVDNMRQQIAELRSMLDDDPSQRRFTQRERRDESRFRD